VINNQYFKTILVIINKFVNIKCQMSKRIVTIIKVKKNLKFN